MVIKYVGKEVYVDIANRFVLNKGDLLEIEDEEAEGLLKLKEFSKVKED